MDTTEVSMICRALGDPNRLRIISVLTGGEKCACKLLEEFDITQPTLSHHMKILSECGLVNVRRDGKWSYYSLDCGTFAAFKDYIGAISCCDGKAR